MTIELPDVNIGSQPLTSEQARTEIACGLYAGWKATMTQAARIAGMPRILFMKELGRRKIHRQYRVEDVEHDMRMAEEFAAKKIAA